MLSKAQWKKQNLNIYINKASYVIFACISYEMLGECPRLFRISYYKPGYLLWFPCCQDGAGCCLLLLSLGHGLLQSQVRASLSTIWSGSALIQFFFLIAKQWSIYWSVNNMARPSSSFSTLLYIPYACLECDCFPNFEVDKTGDDMLRV